MNLAKAQNYIQSKISATPETAIVLGSGLGDFANIIKEKTEIKFSEIPGYLLPTVKGHEGKLIFGKINGKTILSSQGRFHFYEGFSIEEVTFPIQLFHYLGCKNLIITNSSGCLQKEWNIGGFMNISSLLDFTFQKPNNLNKTLINHQINVLDIVQKMDEDFKFYDGCYTWTLGPTYETPAEIDEIKKLGGNVVGMSTYPEMQKAIELGLNTIGISCLTNYAAGITENPLTHHEVVTTAEKANKNFSKLIEQIIINI